MSTLVLVAHPDDEVLGCGGTILKLWATDEKVQVVILGEGRPSTDKKVLRTQISRAARQVQAASWEFLEKLPDNETDKYTIKEIANLIRYVLEEHQPTTIYTHHAHDLNIDHRRIHESLLVATRPGSLSFEVKEIRAFMVPSSTEWTYQHTFSPNIFVEITPDMLAAKHRAMNQYTDETTLAKGHPRSAKSIEAYARYWGGYCGYEFAEPFELVRRFE